MTKIIEFLIKSLKLIFVLLIFALYFYTPILRNFPIMPRYFLFFIGLIYYIYVFFLKKYNFNNRKLLRRLSWCIFGYLYLSFFSLIISNCNHCLDVSWFKSTFLIIFDFIAFLPVFFVMKKFKFNTDFDTISDIIITINSAQMIIALFLFFNPNLNQQVLNLFYTPEIIKRIGYRLNGIGSAFFGGGIRNAITLILISYKILQYKKTYKSNYRFIIYCICLFINGFIGLGMARTTLIGFIGTVLLLICRYNKYILPKLSKVSIIVLCTILLVTNIVSNVTKEKIYNLTRYSFQLFINYLDGKGLKTSSTEGTYSGYKRFSKNIEIKTLIIGDAMLKDPYSSKYYMHTDAGHLRLIYYSGLFGLLLYFSIFGILIYLASLQNRNRSLYFLSLFFIFLIWNIKGLAHPTIFIYPFFYTEIEKSKERT